MKAIFVLLALSACSGGTPTTDHHVIGREIALYPNAHSACSQIGKYSDARIVTAISLQCMAYVQVLKYNENLKTTQP